MLNIPSILGVFAGLSSIALWVIFSFWNPESNIVEAAPVTILIFMLFLPACLAIFASFKTKKRFMIIAFLWSLPFSLYTAMTLGETVNFKVLMDAFLQ